MIPLDELERLAREATPGPWWSHDFTAPEINQSPTSRDVAVSCVTPDHITVAEMGGGLDGHNGLSQARNDAAYIAAANPSTILALVERVRKLEEALKPFAKLKCVFGGKTPDDIPQIPDSHAYRVVWNGDEGRCDLTLGQFRRARAALGGSND